MGSIINRRRTKKETYCKDAIRYAIRKALRKTKKTSQALSCRKILKLTTCWPRFIGCFSEKVLSSLKFFTKPVFLMVHIGDQTGHWIALGIFPDKIEIFDPLGFKIFDWPSVPCALLNFLHTNSTNKKLVVAGKVQPNYSHLCGFYCLLYIYKRSTLTMSQIESLLSDLKTNDTTLASLF